MNVPNNNHKRTKTMTEAAQVAHEANSQHSTGPGDTSLTRFNGVTCGLRGDNALLPWEDKREYEGFIQAYLYEYQPVGVEETRLILRVAQNDWRQERAMSTERQVAMAAENLPDTTVALGRVAMYEVRIEGNTGRILKRFKHLKAQRQLGERTHFAEAPVRPVVRPVEYRMTGPRLRDGMPLDKAEGREWRQDREDQMLATMDTPPPEHRVKYAGKSQSWDNALRKPARPLDPFPQAEINPLAPMAKCFMPSGDSVTEAYVIQSVLFAPPLPQAGGRADAEVMGALTSQAERPNPPEGGVSPIHVKEVEDLDEPRCPCVLWKTWVKPPPPDLNAMLAFEDPTWIPFARTVPALEKPPAWIREWCIEHLTL